MTSDRRRPSTFALGLAVAAVVGLVVRLVEVLVVNPDIPALSDAGWYHGVANALADGRGYVHPYLLGADPPVVVPTADFPPVLPFLLAPFSWVGADTVTAHKLVLAVVGTATVVAVGFLGRRVATPLGERTAVRVGVAAAGLAAVYPPLWILDGSLMAETPFVLLVVCALLATYRAVERPDAARVVVLGVLLGLAVLTRSEGFVLVPLLVVPLAWRVGRAGWRRGLATAALGLATLALVLVPWTVRNLVSMDGLVLGGNNSGGALAGSNCDSTYHGPGTGMWDIGCIFAANDADPVERDETERAAHLRRVGLSYARHHAGDVPRVAAVRALRVWGLYPTDTQMTYQAAEARTHGTVVLAHRTYLVVTAAALGGLVVARRRRVLVWPLLVGAIGATVVAVATYGNERFRAGVEPSIVVLAALAGVVAFEAWAARRSPDRQALAPASGTQAPGGSS